MNHRGIRSKWIIALAGSLILPLIWIFASVVLKIPERYLPSPIGVFLSAYDIEPNILVHTWKTLTRLLVGFILGSAVGIVSGIYLYRYERLRSMSLPSLQGIRSIPPVAVVPFFLLWFGFSETGKWLLVVVGVAANLSFATYQILLDTPEKYIFALTSFGVRKDSLSWIISLPLVLERLLPTLRFSLSTSIGLIVVSELLGSQTGLGYLIQSARSTFSMQTIFLCGILLGVMNAVVDWGLVRLWKAIVFWRQI